MDKWSKKDFFNLIDNLDETLLKYQNDKSKITQDKKEFEMEVALRFLAKKANLAKITDFETRKKCLDVALYYADNYCIYAPYDAGKFSFVIIRYYQEVAIYPNYYMKKFEKWTKMKNAPEEILSQGDHVVFWTLQNSIAYLTNIFFYDKTKTYKFAVDQENEIFYYTGKVIKEDFGHIEIITVMNEVLNIRKSDIKRSKIDEVSYEENEYICPGCSSNITEYVKKIKKTTR